MVEQCAVNALAASSNLAPGAKLEPKQQRQFVSVVYFGDTMRLER